jgi:hypothetical protein
MIKFETMPFDDGCTEAIILRSDSNIATEFLELYAKKLNKTFHRPVIASDERGIMIICDDGEIVELQE